MAKKLIIAPRSRMGGGAPRREVLPAPAPPGLDVEARRRVAHAELERDPLVRAGLMKRRGDPRYANGLDPVLRAHLGLPNVEKPGSGGKGDA